MGESKRISFGNREVLKSVLILLRLIGIGRTPAIAVFISGKQGTTVYAVVRLLGAAPTPRQERLNLYIRRRRQGERTADFTAKLQICRATAFAA